MAEELILSHDMGTSYNKAVLITVHGEIIGTVKQEYPLDHPSPGFAEQNPLDWWDAICNTTRKVMTDHNVNPKNIVGITFSSQMQALIPVDRNGKPLAPCMTWLDGRSADIIRERLWTPPRILGYNIFRLIRFLRITGGCPGHTGKDQIGKLLWLREYKPEIFAAAHKFIDAKDFILFQLTGNFVTSVDLAVIWWLLDTRKNRNRWHSGLCGLAGIIPDRLSEVRASAEVIGKITPAAAAQTGLVAGTPVINGAGDLSAAALGSGAIEEGELHISIGTSGWVGGHFRQRKIDLVHYAGCIGSTYPRKYYLAMAHQETAGLCLNWLKSEIFQVQNPSQQGSNDAEIYRLLDHQADQVPPGADGLLFTPLLYGERCPLDDDSVRGGFFNLSLNHTRGHLIRAVLEGIAFNTRWALETLENLYAPVKQLNIIGGGANSDLWCQIIADITNKSIHQVADPQEAGARGVALLASKTLGYIDSYSAIKNHIKIKNRFHPNPHHRELYDNLFQEFKKLYKQNKKWHARMNKNRSHSI